MPIVSNGKNVTEVFYGTTPITQVFYGASLVWQKSKSPLARLAGVEAAAMWVTRDQAYTFTDTGRKFSAILDEGEAYTQDFTPTITDNGIRTWAYMGPESQMTWTQDGRIALDVKISGGVLTATSNGDRKAVISYTVPWPDDGWHWVLANADPDWHGYSLGIFIDGIKVGEATNGGAFKQSENFLLEGVSSTLRASGDVAAVSADGNSYKSSVTQSDDLLKYLSDNVWTSHISTTGEWEAVDPTAEMSLWLVSGQYDNTMAYNIPEKLTSGALVIGAPGEPSTMGGYTSDDGTLMTPTAFGYTANVYQVIGLVVFYRWPKP